MAGSADCTHESNRRDSLEMCALRHSVKGKVGANMELPVRAGLTCAVGLDGLEGQVKVAAMT